MDRIGAREAFPRWRETADHRDGPDRYFIRDLRTAKRVDLAGDKIESDLAHANEPDALAAAILSDCRAICQADEPGTHTWLAGSLLAARVLGWQVGQHLYAGRLREANDQLMDAVEFCSAHDGAFLVALAENSEQMASAVAAAHDRFTWALYTCDRYLHTLDGLTEPWFDRVASAVACLLPDYPNLSYCACALVSWAQERAIHEAGGPNTIALVQALRQSRDAGQVPADLLMEFEILDTI